MMLERVRCNEGWNKRFEIVYSPNCRCERCEGEEGRGRSPTTTYGLRRCELPLRMTSTPPRPAAAMTACLAPKSIPTTDMVPE